MAELVGLVKDLGAELLLKLPIYLLLAVVLGCYCTGDKREMMCGPSRSGVKRRAAVRRPLRLGG